MVLFSRLLKSFKVRVGHSPGFGLPSVAILPRCAESDVSQYTLYIPVLGQGIVFAANSQEGVVL